MMRLAGVDFSIADAGQRRPLLTGLSLDFADGRFTCITGPSGTGKTTILSLLAGVCVPDAGQVLDDGRDIAGFTDAGRVAWRRQRVGLVFQTCRLIDVLTAEEHMDMVARLRGAPAAAADGRTLLVQLGLADKLGHRPAQLSGGEKQRVALAQALAARPAILLADEPTAALDAGNAAFVAQTLKAYAETTGAVVAAVSHDAAMISTAHDQRVLVK
jgi:putative ABC transport system ATP-binding protein